MTAPVLSVHGLRTHFFTRAGVVKAVDDVSFDVARGEVMGLVGESGAGKSITGYSILGLVDPPGRIVAGSIVLDGVELVGLPPEEMRVLRGNRVAMIFQAADRALDPVLRIDVQMIEAIRAHENVSASAARERARATLAALGIPSPDQQLVAYPHQLSGGTRRRVAIATAIINRPELIIADEPTSPLDVMIRGPVFHELQKLTQETKAALIWITQDLSVVAGLADRIAIMYAGRIVEQGACADVLVAPAHPYTRGLLDSLPMHNRRGARLRQIPGLAPSLVDWAAGCAFRDRCPHAGAVCAVAPPTTDVEGHRARRTVCCHHPIPGVPA